MLLTTERDQATIHSLVPQHPNVVTLHRTLQTDSFLLLVLEFVPGEDLFYFLKQARDQFGLSPDVAVAASPSIAAGLNSVNGVNGVNGTGNGLVSGVDVDDSMDGNGNANGDGDCDGADSSGCSSGTPQTPSLLTTFTPGQILSKTRLKLIASMFGQVRVVVLFVFFLRYNFFKFILDVRCCCCLSRCGCVSS